MKKLYFNLLLAILFGATGVISAQNVSDVTITPTGGGTGGSGEGALGTDFSSVPITVEQGETLNVTFTLTHGSNNVERHFGVIKSAGGANPNQSNAVNVTYAHPGETSPHTNTISVVVYPTATLGTNVLRLNGKNWTNPTTSGWGTAIDIDITVVAAGSLSTNDKNAFEFRAYPNPVKDILHINTLEPISKVEIFDLLGKSVFTQYNVTDNINVASLNKSMYLVKLTSDNGVSTKKFLKE
ncbi:T9SS type A sorting domain-containing protein [Seonamhaeicola marinus]|uniref:T9SS type A sorting domain-containing protein n=1 Tax=Seonamhaeicola marinus TaxID=1912246 RepID=A0A5D0JAJ0_9FLAO|nr:T9SS type A sorting domain-containing protein [Seonamhaeicola marinus]TYA92140.1 T9SS type A sorting domain-containing protein [Seonamhaeicola marinus]